MSFQLTVGAEAPGEHIRRRDDRQGEGPGPAVPDGVTDRATDRAPQSPGVVTEVGTVIAPEEETVTSEEPVLVVQVSRPPPVSGTPLSGAG